MRCHEGRGRVTGPFSDGWTHNYVRRPGGSAVRGEGSGGLGRDEAATAGVVLDDGAPVVGHLGTGPVQAPASLDDGTRGCAGGLEHLVLEAGIDETLVGVIESADLDRGGGAGAVCCKRHVATSFVTIEPQY